MAQNPPAKRAGFHCLILGVYYRRQDTPKQQCARLGRKKETTMKKMPVVFVGHGSPMNIIEKNRFTTTWAGMAEQVPHPKAILCVSAHWFGEGQFVCTAPQPKTIHDFYGFPPELYEVEYPAPGAPELAASVVALKGGKVMEDSGWGLDHGAWSVLHFMYPNADIPVCQLSVNAANMPMESYRMGEVLRPLREEGVLILGSGNIVHNLTLVDWDRPLGGFDWADAFDETIRDAIVEGRHGDVIHYETAGPAARQAFGYRDHYDPLLYVLGASESGEKVQVFNDERVMGSLSMTSYIIGG